MSLQDRLVDAFRYKTGQRMLEQALEEILKANDDFRSSLPEGWDGDPVNDACIVARAVLQIVREQYAEPS